MSLNQPFLLLFASSVISLFLSFYAWKRRHNNAGMSLALLLAAATFWSFFYGLEVASTTHLQILVYGSFAYLGIATVPVLWLIFAARYSGNDNWLTPLNRAFLFIIPFISIVLVATSDLHNLYYTSAKLKLLDGYTYQKYEAGPFFWVHITYSYMVVAAGLVFFTRMFFRVAHSQRWHIGFFIAGSILPYVVNIAYIAGFKPYGFLDLTPIAFIVMGVILVFGIYTIKLFDINPLVLDLLFNNIPDAIFVLDSNKRIINTNPAAHALLNSLQKKGDGFFTLNSFLPDEHSLAKDDLYELEFNEKIYHKKNTVINSSKGKYLGILIVLHDITERKQYEGHLLKNELRLKELNASKDKFFSIIAHDLKNPFNSILGFSNILMEMVQEKDYEAVEEYAEIIQNSSQRAMNLLMNLMEWSRSQIERMEFNPETIDIIALINEVTELLKYSAQLKSITIYKENDQNVMITADKAMMSNVLRNLISNAVKYTRPGGSIVISTKQKQDELLVNITDNGIGINKENLEKLFRIDESYSTPGTQNETGTGLGLLICKEFIDKHGGKIWVESEPDKGSTFHFTIPIS